MVKYKLIYNRKNKLKKDGTALVQLELYKNRSRKYITTEVAVTPEQWIEKSSRVNYTHSRADEFNMILHDLIQKIEEILRRGKLKDVEYSLDEIVELLEHNDSEILTDFIAKEIEKDQRIKKKTKMDLMNTRNRIMEFRPNVRLQEVDYRFILDLDNYLRTKNYTINTIGKIHKNLKRFLNLAIKYNLISQNDYPYRNFKVQRESKKRESLNLKEINNIETLQYDKKTINYIVKDMFLFACYTGLRISDIMRLRTIDCKQAPNGWFLDFKSFKTQKQAYIPLWSLFTNANSKSKPEVILESYYSSGSELLFPTTAESRVNRHLKEIAKQAGITKNVTFHMGRHSFGTIMASKIPLPTLQSLMQHSDIKTTMIYVNMSNDMIDENLAKVNWNN